MKMLLFLIHILIVYCSDDVITQMTRQKLFSKEVYDVYNYETKYTMLTQDRVYLMNNNDISTTNNFILSTQATEYSSIWPYENGYLISCTELNMIEYYSNTNEQKSSIPKNGENIGSKCTISVVKDFIVISFLNDEIHCQINSYSINNEFKLAVTTTYIDVINLIHSNSNLFHCISLGINQNNIECFYIEKKDKR